MTIKGHLLIQIDTVFKKIEKTLAKSNLSVIHAAFRVDVTH